MNLFLLMTIVVETSGQAAYWGQSCGKDISLGKTQAGVYSCVTKKELEQAARELVRRQYDVKNLRSVAVKELKETGQWYDRSRAIWESHAE